MCEPFIRNYEYNFIKKQVEHVIRTIRTVGDPKILESVRLGAQANVAELFSGLEDNRRTMVESLSDLRTEAELQNYLQELESYLIEFPQITSKQIQKLFPKNKKLKLPDLTQTDFRYVTYLSWTDIATNKMFIVYPMGGQFVGIEGRFTPSNKKSYCFACNRLEQLVLFSAITKKRPANASPDYYKSVGNYICMNGHECNKNITDVAPLEKFIHSVLG